ncbi:MAG: response regulator [Rickettsiales bacterium]
MAKKYKIVLVEDDPLSAKLAHDFLVYKGYDVIHINNGLHVMDAVQLNKPDLILMDIQVFGKSGIECAQEIRATEEFKDSYIFAVSAFTKDKILKEEEMPLFDEYVEKPIVFSDFMELIQSYLIVQKDDK